MEEDNRKSDRNTDRDLVRKVEHLEELNLTIAHNLRGGLSNIKLLTELLMEKKTTKRQLRKVKSSVSTSDALQYIYDSSISLLGSLNAFIDISKIHLEDAIPSEKCDIAAIIQQVTDQLQGHIKDKNGAIHLYLAVTHITCPRIYLESILYNLISNAIKYAKQDIPAEVSVISYNENGHIVLKVKDNGIGINLAANKGKLFKLYQTFHKGYDSKGVGLYMTKVQIESMGGTIRVKSLVNEGTEFTITF